MQSKLVATPREAIQDVRPGMAIMAGGFANMISWPPSLLLALAEHGAGELTLIANAVGYGPYSPEVLAERRLLRKFIGSFGGHTGIPTATEDQIVAGDIEFEVVPQGTFIERIRAAGAGLPAFYTPTAADTDLATTDREIRIFDGRPYLLETALRADFALLRASVADEAGNCRFEGTTRTFQPVMASAATTVVVEVEEVVPIGALAPEDVHLPGIFVDRVVQSTVTRAQVVAEEIARSRDPLRSSDSERATRGIPRDLMALRVARMIAGKRYVNLGVGLPNLVGGQLESLGADMLLHAENGILGYRSVDDLDRWNPTFFDAGSRPIEPVSGSSLFDSTMAFTMARGGHLDAVVLGAYEVSCQGDLANWALPGVGAPRIGGAMDLLAGRAQLIVLMEHTTRDGRPRLVEECTLPVTGRRCVSTVVTNLAVLDVTSDGVVLREVAPGVTPEEVAAATGCPLIVRAAVPVMDFG